jgi:hypothetical protein
MHHIRKDERFTTADIAGRKPGEGEHNTDTEGETENAADSRPGGPQLIRRVQGVPERDIATERAGPLFPDRELQEMGSRWDEIQTGFVDEPRHAVEQADSLVAVAIKRLAGQFAEERSRLESQWARGDNVSTEDLRQALRRYRAFFDRLLSV